MGILGTGLMTRLGLAGNTSGGGAPNPANSIWNKIGLAGDIVTGNPVTQNRLQQQALDALRQQQADADAQRAATEAMRADRAQLFNGGNGQITAVDPNTLAVTQLQAAQPEAPHVPEQQQLIDEWQRRRAANPNDPTLPLLDRAIRGYQYSAPVMDARQQNIMAAINARGAQARQTRAMPTYGNLHPHSAGGGAGNAGGAALHVSDADLLNALRGGH